MALLLQLGAVSIPKCEFLQKPNDIRLSTICPHSPNQNFRLSFRPKKCTGPFKFSFSNNFFLNGGQTKILGEQTYLTWKSTKKFTGRWLQIVWNFHLVITSFSRVDERKFWMDKRKKIVTNRTQLGFCKSSHLGISNPYPFLKNLVMTSFRREDKRKCCLNKCGRANVVWFVKNSHLEAPSSFSLLVHFNVCKIL